MDGQHLLQHSQLGLGLTISVKEIGPEPLFIPRKKKKGEMVKASGTAQLLQVPDTHTSLPWDWGSTFGDGSKPELGL